MSYSLKGRACRPSFFVQIINGLDSVSAIGLIQTDVDFLIGNGCGEIPEQAVTDWPTGLVRICNRSKNR